jgi:alcohol dehydrogenase (cytochrome c)
MEWAAGKGFMGGSFAQAPTSRRSGSCARFDIQTGKIVWELPQTGAVDSWGACSAPPAASSIFGEDSGALMAADADTASRCGVFQTSQLWKASPMTYMFDNRQYIAVASGPNIIAVRAAKLASTRGLRAANES